jgi:hypothetical protein
MEVSDQLLASDWSLFKEEHCGLFSSSLLWWQHKGRLSGRFKQYIYIYIYNVCVFVCVCLCSCWKITQKWIRELVLGGVSWIHWAQITVQFRVL